MTIESSVTIEYKINVPITSDQFVKVLKTSGLAASQKYQSAGIGKHLQYLTQQQLGPHTKLILLAAPTANNYYAHIGFSHHPRCWVLERDCSFLEYSEVK